MRPGKNIKIFLNYFLGPVLFAWLAWSIYRQIQNQPQLEDSWMATKTAFGSAKLWNLVFTLFLMTLNWGLEAVKWKLSISTIYHLGFWKSFKAVLSGVSFSVTTPNRIGEYLGRMVYMPEGFRLKIIPITLIGSLSQILVTLLMGTLALIVLKPHLMEAGILSPLLYRLAFWVLCIITLISAFIYFTLRTIGGWLKKWLYKGPYLYLVEAIPAFGMQRLLNLFTLSLCRYGVFTTQYLLVSRFFEVNIPLFQFIWSLSLVFLVLAVIPSVTLIELGIRGEVSLLLLGMFTTNNLGILLTSVTVWFINLVVPAFIGSALILSIKVFKRKHAPV